MLRTSVFLLGIALLVLMGGTYAVFNDVEKSEGNFVEAGTLDIHLENHESDANEQWLYINAWPGGATFTRSGTIKIYNDGSIQGDHIEITFKLVCYEDDDGDIFVDPLDPTVPNDPYNFTYDKFKHKAGPESDTNQSGIGDWPLEIKVTKLTYEHWGTTEICNATNPCTLKELTERVYKFEDIPLPSNINPNDFARIQMDIEIENKQIEQNDWQGDVCELRIIVALAQDPNQVVLKPGGIEVILPPNDQQVD